MALTKIVASRSGHRTTLIPFPGTVDDGSTLSLDFTTGILDPRLTFTRTSNATFINSSGLVAWAAANMFSNSAWNDATATPSGWSAFGLSATATVAIASDPEARTIAVTTGAGNQPFLFVAPTVSQGIVYTASVEIVSVTHGSGGATEEVQYNQVLAAPFSSTFAYYMNGSSVGASAKVTQTGVLTCVYVAASSSQIRIGFASAPRNNCSVTIKAPQHQPGEAKTRTAFFRRTAAEGAYYGPRFDYDPNPTSIGTPRGLLIEGSATNYSNYSETFPTAPSSGTAWGRLEVTANATLQTSPNGTANAIAFNETTNNAIHRLSHAVTAVAGAITCSVWVKVIDGSAPRRLYINAATMMGAGALFDIDPAVQTGASGSAINVAGTAANRAGTWVKYPNGWYRCSVVGTYVASATIYLQLNRASSTTATDDTYAGSTSNGLMIWGFQVEAGSGASSYIPTGASTGSRVADVCTIGVDAGTATNFSSWWPLNQSQFTVAWTGDLVRNTSTVQFLWLTRNSVNTSVMRVFANSTSGQPLLGFAGNSIPTSVTVNGIPGATLKTALAAQEGDQAFYANNGTVSSSGVAANTGLAFTSVSMNFNPNADQFMHIKSFKFWPTRLPNAQLQALTT